MAEPQAQSTVRGVDAVSNPVASLSPPSEHAADPAPRRNPVLTPKDDTPSPTPAAEAVDLYKLSARAVLAALSRGLDRAIEIAGDAPPPSPPRSPLIPHMRGFEAEKESISRSHSERNLARLAERTGSMSSPPPLISPANSERSTPTPDSRSHSTPGSTTAASLEDPQLLNLQHIAVTRKFYSRHPPPHTIAEYLARLHQYCPFSAAVYLAASLYIHRLVVEERVLVPNKRNVHRLLLAALTVAMKTLEDACYTQSRLARVGGVTKNELTRLEVSFCFLAGFDLFVTSDALSRHWLLMRSGRGCWDLGEGLE